MIFAVSILIGGVSPHQINGMERWTTVAAPVFRIPVPLIDARADRLDHFLAVGPLQLHFERIVKHAGDMAAIHHHPFSQHNPRIGVDQYQRPRQVHARVPTLQLPLLGGQQIDGGGLIRPILESPDADQHERHQAIDKQSHMDLAGMKSVQGASRYDALINLQQMMCLDAGVVPVFHRSWRPMVLAPAKRLTNFQSAHQLLLPNLPSHRAFRSATS
jgi:hypothetical protein